METDNKYNGWTNYATWRINLEVFDGNDELIQDLVSECKEVPELSEMMAGYVNAFIEDGLQYPYGSNRNEAPINQILLGWLTSFVSECNFYEIAQHYTELLFNIEES